MFGPGYWDVLNKNNLKDINLYPIFKRNNVCLQSYRYLVFAFSFILQSMNRFTSMCKMEMVKQNSK